VPCYYFHFTDGKRIFRDAAGVDLPDVAQAREEAIRCARFVMAPCADDEAAPNWRAWKVVVADEVSPKLLELPFADIEPPS
jgi:hypothetical protein